MTAVHDVILDQASFSTGEESAESAKRRQILEGARKVFLARGFDGSFSGRER